MYTVFIFSGATGGAKYGLTTPGVELAVGLKTAGVRVQILCGTQERDPGLFRKLEAEGIPYHFMPGHMDISLARPAKAQQDFVELAALKAEGTIIFQCFGVRQVHLANQVARRLRRQSRQARVAVLVTSLRHGTRYEWLAYRLGAMLLNLMADLICPLNPTDAVKLRSGGLPERKIMLSSNWRDLSLFEAQAARPLPADVTARLWTSVAGTPLPEGDPLLVYASAYTSGRKAHPDLFRAVKHTRDHGKRVSLICVGEGPAADPFRSEVKELGIAEAVSIPGRVPIDLIAPLLKRAALVAIPSKAETFGMSIIEPLYLGVPVVSTRVGCVPDLEKVNALKAIDIGDWQALAREIAWTLDHPGEASAMALSGRAWVDQTLSLGAFCTRLKGGYERLPGVTATGPARTAARLQAKGN